MTIQETLNLFLTNPCFSRIKSSNPTAAAQILSRLKANICNKEEKKICCPLRGSGEKSSSSAPGKDKLLFSFVISSSIIQSLFSAVVPPNSAGLPSLPNCGGREDNGAQIVGGIDAEV